MSVNNNNGDGEDRISNLTDDLLHKILSFLNTKYAIRTCILSKRWKFLWRTLPYLNFNINTFQCQEGNDKLERAMNCFSNFISQVLFLREPTGLVKVCSYGFFVEGLIGYAVEKNVQQLLVHSISDSAFLLPESLFSCQSLRVLHLHANGCDELCIKLPKFLALRALKTLHLGGFSMSGPNFDSRLFPGCPNLETLKLYEIFVPSYKNLYLNAPKLKNFELSFKRARNEIYRCKLVIDAPKLTTFKYHGYTLALCSNDNLPFLDYAHFYIDPSEHKEKEYALQLINTLKVFRLTKSLLLSTRVIEVLAKFPSLLDESNLSFANLKYLKIKFEGETVYFEASSNVMNYFLNDSVTFSFGWGEGRYSEVADLQQETWD